jgi:hypothetical protein
LFVSLPAVLKLNLSGGITMKRTTAFLAAIVCCAACSTVYALYEVTDGGTWPKTWPEELEPLRKQARTLTGPIFAQPHYEIPFTKREDFESVWTHLLKVKSKGAPVILVRAPDARLGMQLNAGVRIWSPPPQKEDRRLPETALPGRGNPRERWMYTTFIELVVDGDIVDLNRIVLPADTPIIDERFNDSQSKSPNPGGN